MKKKLFLLIAVLGLMGLTLVLASCTGARVATETVITSPEGAGTKTLIFQIDKDRETEWKTNNDGEQEATVYNNETYFPKGYQALIDYLQPLLGDNFKLELDSTSNATEHYIKVSFSFTSIDDYIAKCKELAGEDNWNYCISEKKDEPHIYSSKVEDPEDPNYGKIKLTFTESRYMKKILGKRLAMLVASQDAYDAGVFYPYGDVKKNKDLDADAIETNVIKPDNIFDYGAVKQDTYTFMDATYTESMGNNPQISIYVEDDGRALEPDIPTIIGRDIKWTDEEKLDDEAGFGYKDPFPVWGIVLIVVGALVVVGVVVVVVIAVKKKHDEEYEYVDDDEDEEDEEDGE